MWFVKSKRAQSSDDDETWIEGGVAPTLNAFDNGDTRATVVIVMREREGRAGGGKGPLLSEKSFTLSTNNFQTIFVFNPHPWDGARLQHGDRINTLAARMGTGGNNVPFVCAIQGNMIGRSDDNGPQGSGVSEDVMFTLTKTDKHGVAMATTVRRLTPTECERLQGFPDNWTDQQADSHRYKQMGNAVAVPVVNWIIGRIIKDGTN